jgi:hypothetical protein
MFLTFRAFIHLLTALGLLTMICFLVAQDSVGVENSALGSTRLKNVDIQSQSIEGLFSALSLSYDIPIGLEIAIDDSARDVYYLKLASGTLSDLLTQFAEEYPEYDWEIKDSVVNIHPKKPFRDNVLGKILEVQVPSFSVTPKTNCWTLESRLTQIAGVKEITDAYGLQPQGLNFSGPQIPQLGRNFTLELTNVTIRSLLNRVVKESPTAKIWIMKKYTNQPIFFIRFNARDEDWGAPLS